MDIADLIDKLTICNAKLYDVCSKKANCQDMTREELVALCQKDIALCAERSRLKNDINKFFGVKQPGEVKTYGA